MSEENSTVEYRDIPEFPGYRVGNDGSVWSEWRRKGRGNQRGWSSYRSGIWSRRKASKYGKYLVVTLRHETGKIISRLAVHRLVLSSFVGECPKGHFGLHKDDDGTNNRLDNLYWGTHCQNMEDMKRNGNSTAGEKHPMAKIGENTVKEIRILLSEGLGPSQISKRLGINAPIIQMIKLRIKF